MSQAWTFVCATAELLPGEMSSVVDEVTEAPIMVFNFQGELYALEDLCSHREYELSTGFFDAEAGHIECLYHGAKFDVRDGSAVCAPAHLPVIKFPVKIEHGGIWTRDDRE